jgi:general secretion pathway protein N
MKAGVLRWPRAEKRHASASTVTGWSESTHAELAWKSSRRATFRWAIAGAVVGAVVALIAFAPASWLAAAVAGATGQTFLLADARGTVWNGSATPVLTGGRDSRDAAALPGRLNWSLAWRPWFALELRLTQPCCLPRPMVLTLRPGLGRFSATLLPPPAGADEARARWPAAWLSGLGTPWNTLQLGGDLRVASPGLTLERVQGRWRLAGRADIELVDMASRVSMIAPLGSYRLTLAAEPATPGLANVRLETLEGALQLIGSGTWGPNGLRFRGEASAQAGDEAALANLLNIIGRRSGARSAISIG